MTIEDIKRLPKETLTPQDVAPLLGCWNYSINKQAQADPGKLGFPVSVMGSRIYIPKDGFVNWWMGWKNPQPAEEESTPCA